MKRKNHAWIEVLLFMFCGIIFGILSRYIQSNYQEGSLFYQIFHFSYHCLNLTSQLYTNLLKMIIVPIMSLSIMYGIINVQDIKSFRRIGLKSFVIYITSSIISILIGILCAIIIRPGMDIDFDFTKDIFVSNSTIQHQNLIEIVSSIIPTNPIESMSKGHTLQIIFFTTLLGIAAISIEPEKSKYFRNFINSLMNITFKLVDFVMKTTPYGVFAVMSCLTLNNGIGFVIQLLWFVYTNMLAFFIQYIILFLGILIFGKISPIPFFKKILYVQSIALSTSSTKATLPNAMDDMQNKIGASEKIVKFVLPLGASINMSAVSIYLGISAIFFTQIFNIELNIYNYLILVLSCTIGSIGAAGIPSGSIIMLGMVLSSINIPLVGIPILMSIDRIIDMLRTAVNITGDCAITLIIDKNEKTLNLKKYYE